MYRAFGKRLMDFSLALLGLLVLLPVFLVIFVLLLVYNRGSAFFFQERPGYREKAFWVIKFKTMNERKDPEGNLLPNYVRTTSFGSFLRKSSLDEFPQLINVLKGDMSLVGPRPLLFKYIPLYSKTQTRRHSVKPGITGLAQVNGRNAISWTKKFEFDILYVDKVSFMFDLNVLWLTFLKVVKREGVNASDNVTSEPFNGSN